MHISGISQLFLMKISGKAQAHHRHNLGISRAHFWHISVKYQTTLKHISGISQVYFRSISNISYAYLRFIPGIPQQVSNKLQCKFQIRHDSGIPHADIMRTSDIFYANIIHKAYLST